MPLILSTLPSPIGTILLVTDAAGTLRALDFEDYRPRMDRLLLRHYGPMQPSPGPVPDRIHHALNAYFTGDLTTIDTLPVATNGTDFQKQVWAALRGIPAGTTTTYGALATQIDRPSAIRAAGLANGANPIGIVVPCHRVIGADGALTGYGGGLERKAWLLRHEGAGWHPSRRKA